MDRFKRLILIIAGVIIIFVLLYFNYVGKSFSNWIPLLALICLFFGMIDRLKSFSASFSGFEAETRKVLNKTQNVLDELQLVSKEISKATVEAMKTSGRLGGIPEEVELDVELNLLNSLEDIGLSDSEIEEVKVVAEKYDRFDYAVKIRKAVNRKFEGKDINWGEIYGFSGIGSEPKPEALKQFLKEENLLDQDIEELVVCYEYYCENLEHKDADLWMNRDDWLRD